MYKDAYGKAKNVAKGIDDSLLEVFSFSHSCIESYSLMKKKHKKLTKNSMMMFFLNGVNSEKLFNLKYSIHLILFLTTLVL